MAQPTSHFSFSTLLGIGYALFGVYVLNIQPELAVLAALAVMIGGVLPNVDASDSPPAKEFGGFLAALAPIILMELYPSLKLGGTARIALVVICSYLITKLVVQRFLTSFTVHRGMLHSIPAAIVTFELVYLLFWDMATFIRLYIAAGAFLGFIMHLIVDATGNIDFWGRAMGNSTRKPAALKLAGPSWGGNFAWYGTALVLGWMVLKDFYPQLGIYAGVKY